MNLRNGYSDVPISDGVNANVARIDQIWKDALSKADGNWLCGEYSIADAFYAPVAMRIAGYGVPVSEIAQSYIEQHLNDLAFRRWRAMGLAKGATLPWYDKDFPKVAWPGPSPLTATAVSSGPSENALCPYSDEPVTHFLALEGKVYGFCNEFCRDKTLHDPLAWPAFVKIYQS